MCAIMTCSDISLFVFFCLCRCNTYSMVCAYKGLTGYCNESESGCTVKILFWELGFVICSCVLKY